MSIYYNYAPDGSKIVVLSYVDDCVYWYTNEYLGKWFVDTLGKRLHVNFLGFAHWFIDINQCANSKKSHEISFPRCQQTILQCLHLHTNKHNHQHKIEQQSCIHQVHTYSRLTCDIVIE